MAPDETTPTPDATPETDVDGEARPGPVRITPAKMVVSGRPKGGRKKAATAPAKGASPAASGATDGPGPQPSAAPIASPAPAPGPAAPPPPVAPPPAAPAGRADGLVIRRFLLDGAVALAVIGIAILVGSTLLAPREEPVPSEAVASGSPSAVPSDGASAGPSGSAAPSVGPSATPAPPTEPYVVSGPCLDDPYCSLYTIRPGDTIATIGAGFGATRTQLLALNPGLTPETALVPGAQLRVPTPRR